jgi:putative long chain acyl-CoA synthase
MGNEESGFGLRAGLRRLRQGARNAAEIVRLGRLTAPHRTPFDIVDEGRIHTLRRYKGPERQEDATVALLVPPLLVTGEVYDMAPDLSAVSYLLGQGVDVWMVEYGRPEQAEGGLERTLDDHLRAVIAAHDTVVRETGRAVHMLGYSQGGMFCYQAAAYLGGEGVASIVTFGSPVDIHANVPIPVGERVAEAMLSGLRQAIEGPLAQTEALPAFLISLGFKLVSPRKEVGQLIDFVQKLHDRPALEKRESRRRFLGGEGFVAWPGPALRTFIDEFIVANRLASGGFVVDGRTVSLADLEVPILYFVGGNDEIARPASVRGIARAALRAEVHEVEVPVGHLGLVVGSKAMARTWPAVVEWMRWREERGPRPTALDVPEAPADPAEGVLEGSVEDVVDLASDALGELHRRFESFAGDLTQTVEALRWQLPRLAVLRRLGRETEIGAAKVLRERAETNPDGTFFLWRGRAFKYAEADRRVDAIVRGLFEAGVRPTDRVGVLMGPRPTYLSLVTALNRLGAVAVLLGPDSTRLSLERAVDIAEVTHLVADPPNVARALEAFTAREVFVLGGPYGDVRPAFDPERVLDLEAIDPETVVLPPTLKLDAARAEDLALIIFTAGRGEHPRAARITNRRWAVSGYGTAATATLEPSDTVYCVVPLHHASGMLVAVGGALVGGCRLALAGGFDPAHFWDEVRRYGATTVFYAGELCRDLVDAPPDPRDGNNPVRLFIGSGLRKDVWERLSRRFDVGVLEFYASTEGNVVLANASGKKVGALGEPLPGSTELVLAAYAFGPDGGDYARDETGRLRRAGVDEPGMLLARVASAAQADFDGYLDREATRARILEDVFEAGDRWFVTGDLLRQDAEGAYHFVDREVDVIVRPEGPVYSREVEDVLYREPAFHLVVVHAGGPGGVAGEVVASVELRRDRELDLQRLVRRLEGSLPSHAWPAYLRVVDRIALSDGYRPLKRPLEETPVAPGEGVHRLEAGAYVPWLEAGAEADA